MVKFWNADEREREREERKERVHHTKGTKHKIDQKNPSLSGEAMYVKIDIINRLSKKAILKTAYTFTRDLGFLFYPSKCI